MGVFGPRNPLFQEMGIRGPVWGRGNPNPRVEVDTGASQPFQTLLTFSSLIRISGVFLSFLSDRDVVTPSDKCAESIAVTGKISSKGQKSSH